ncbi:uncharacterized protein BCR38DRAFT_436651 [Pseudomassariella vexata]|uniref:Mediator of RNA polymerase II transcription subunit 22 n=1 Tax=Pseudomassariella vexata TaxID=1141098 RepID=A0A1Y2DW69_9PEZI|nr:uncharacterized protein BCR38DRAFT_436651 [Pseudomassariella vexata]ORY63354.1 hypothetical protein BCR38DRAFT_436651 [Pseudomassariella vexata]
MDRNKKGQDLMARHNLCIKEILDRFLKMMLAATDELPHEATIESAMLNSMKMESETAALINEIQNLLMISREIKALWIRGPLNPPSEHTEQEKELDVQAEMVQGLYNQAIIIQQRRTKAHAVAVAKGLAGDKTK